MFHKNSAVISSKFFPSLNDKEYYIAQILNCIASRNVNMARDVTTWQLYFKACKAAAVEIWLLQE